VNFRRRSWPATLAEVSTPAGVKMGPVADGLCGG
jgi:hypothetical protein